MSPHRLWASLLVASLLASCTPAPNTQTIVQPPGAPPLTQVEIRSLPGWASDDAAAALATFVRSCQSIIRMPPDQPLGGIGFAQTTAGQAGMLQAICTTARAIQPGNAAAAASFFETNFAAYQMGGQALVTGYFEPEFPGAKNESDSFPVPLYAKPFDASLAGSTRAEIDSGILDRQAPVTAYVSDPVDAFMLQIQGSGRILLDNGEILRVGYDGQNGQPYTPVGRVLVAQGELAPNNVSFQTISAWLKAHPDEASGIMERNARYVFLRPLGDLPDDEGAPGTLGVPLTAGRSLAVDRDVIPLGTPVFVSTTYPLNGQSLNRLTVAQDTGGGIHGAGAADLFFGAGPQAEATAGRMQQPGALYILLPRTPPSAAP